MVNSGWLLTFYACQYHHWRENMLIHFFPLTVALRNSKSACSSLKLPNPRWNLSCLEWLYDMDYNIYCNIYIYINIISIYCFFLGGPKNASKSKLWLHHGWDVYQLSDCFGYDTVHGQTTTPVAIVARFLRCQRLRQINFHQQLHDTDSKVSMRKKVGHATPKHAILTRSLVEH